MKTKTLALLAGVGAPLILTPTSPAGFTGLSWTAKPNAFDLYVVNVYAEFDNPGADWFQHVAGSPYHPLNINVIGGVFYNNQFGSDQAPSTLLVNAFPSLAYDSFFTIGIKAVAPSQINALNLVNLPPLGGTSEHTTGGSWGLVPPDAPQGHPFDPVNSFPGDGRVLIGQFSGEIGISYVSDGAVGISKVSFSSVVPGPNVLGCLGLAGLLGTRRCRRAAGPP